MPADLDYDKQRFVLAVGGRCMDIDASTAFYDSGTRRWRKVHNDSLNHTGEFAARTPGLVEC